MENLKNPLLDVTALSKKLCEVPIHTELKYATDDNFIGVPLPGYDATAKHIALLAPKAAHALCQAQNHFLKEKFCIVIHDAYRPLQTVRYFTEWFHNQNISKREIERKAIHYPHIEKSDLARLGYVARNVSRHCFGFAVDIGLIRLDSRQELDMGAIFDYFDPISGTTATSEQIGEEAYKYRQFLSNIMQQHGFLPYDEEFWHFDYHEKEVQHPLDIPITLELQGIGVP